jgi:prophage regulatory protein
VHQTASIPIRILRLPSVLERVGVHQRTLYRWIRAGRFPAAVRLGLNSIGWREADVDAWLASRAAADPKPAPPRRSS